MLLAIYSYFAEAEREFISMRTKQGLAAARASGKKLGRPKGSRDKERVLDLYREQNKEYLYLGLSLSSIRTILNPQLEIPISYPSYRYFVRQNAKLLELWQTKKGKGWISTVYLRTKMGDTQCTGYSVSPSNSKSADALSFELRVRGLRYYTLGVFFVNLMHNVFTFFRLRIYSKEKCERD